MTRTRGVVHLLTAVCSLAALLLLAGISAKAQDLEPRAYSASPVGLSFVGVAFGRSNGGVAFDPSLPIQDARATLYSPALGLGHTFGLLGRQALFTAALPYAWGNASGVVGNGLQSVSRSGLADVRGRFSINIKGSPALSPREFVQRGSHGVIVGTSLAFVAPSGQYGNTKLINIGSNRWAFKPELGVSVPVKKFDLDLYAGAWFFTANDNFYTGHSIRTQTPLTSLQAHISYTVRRGLWLAVDSTWYGGGQVTVNNGPPQARQNNSRLGVTASLPLSKGNSLKIAYSNGVSGTIGSNFSTVSAGWQYAWFGPHLGR